MARALGTTGLAVSRIGLGLAALGRPGVHRPRPRDALREDPVAYWQTRAALPWN